jgi:hypothetical protein
MLTSAVFLACASAAVADTVGFGVSLDSLQEVPSNPSPASGSGTLTYDTVTNNLHFDITFAGLLGSETAAHLHSGPPGVSGPVILSLPVGSPILTDLTLLEANEPALLAGNTYVNVHTNLYPGGEIRGQVNPVPEPATCALIAGGLAAFGALGRRRAKNFLGA